jgi:hypothetical protein
VKSTEKDMAKTLKFTYDLVLDIGCRWHEVKSTTLNSAWKKVRAPFVIDLVGFDDFLEKIILSVIDIGKQLNLELDEDDITELVNSHGEAVTNEDLILFDCEKQRAVDEEAAEEVPKTPEEKKFSTKLLAEAFSKTDDVLELFERQDTNRSRYASVSRVIENVISCCKEGSCADFFTAYFRRYKRGEPMPSTQLFHPLLLSHPFWQSSPFPLLKVLLLQMTLKIIYLCQIGPLRGIHSIHPLLIKTIHQSNFFELTCHQKPR